MIQYFSGPLLVGPDMKENGRMEIGTVKVHYFPGDRVSRLPRAIFLNRHQHLSSPWNSWIRHFIDRFYLADG